MEPTLDTTVMHELVSQRQQRLRLQADRHALGQSPVPPTMPAPARPARARHRLAEALHHLAERIEPARLEPHSATR